MTPTDTPTEIEELVATATAGGQFVDLPPGGVRAAQRKLRALGFISPARASAYAKLLRAVDKIRHYGGPSVCVACDGEDDKHQPMCHVKPLAEAAIQALAAHKEAGR